MKSLLVSHRIFNKSLQFQFPKSKVFQFSFSTITQIPNLNKNHSNGKLENKKDNNKPNETLEIEIMLQLNSKHTFNFWEAVKLATIASIKKEPLSMDCYLSLIKAGGQKIKSLSRFRDTTEGLLQQMRKVGINPDSIIYDSLISEYNKRNDIKSVQRLYNEIKENQVLITKPNIYNKIISSLLHTKYKPQQIDVILEDMKTNNIKYDWITHNVIVRYYFAKSNHGDKAIEYIRKAGNLRETQYKNHIKSLKHHLSKLDKELSTKILNFFTMCYLGEENIDSPQIDEMISKIKDETVIKAIRNYIYWYLDSERGITQMYNSLLLYSGKVGTFKKVQKWFKIMQKRKIKPDLETFRNVILGLKKNPNLPEIQYWYKYFTKTLHIEADEKIYSLLMNLFAKLGEPKAIIELFDRSKIESLLSHFYFYILTAYRHRGDELNLIKYFKILKTNHKSCLNHFHYYAVLYYYYMQDTCDMRKITAIYNDCISEGYYPGSSLLSLMIAIHVKAEQDPSSILDLYRTLREVKDQIPEVGGKLDNIYSLMTKGTRSDPFIYKEFLTLWSKDFPKLRTARVARELDMCSQLVDDVDLPEFNLLSICYSTQSLNY